VTSFQKALRLSALFIVIDNDDIDVEQLAILYDGVINDIADRLMPVKSVKR